MKFVQTNKQVKKKVALCGHVSHLQTVLSFASLFLHVPFLYLMVGHTWVTPTMYIFYETWVHVNNVYTNFDKTKEIYTGLKQNQNDSLTCFSASRRLKQLTSMTDTNDFFFWKLACLRGHVSKSREALQMGHSNVRISFRNLEILTLWPLKSYLSKIWFLLFYVLFLV